MVTHDPKIEALVKPLVETHRYDNCRIFIRMAGLVYCRLTSIGHTSIDYPRSNTCLMSHSRVSIDLSRSARPSIRGERCVHEEAMRCDNR